MDIQHLSEVRNAVGDEAVEILTTIFDATKPPDSVPAQRFRADNPTWIPVIEKLESVRLFLERSPDGANYRVKIPALPLIQSPRASRLLGYMETMYLVLKDIYREHLSSLISFSKLVEATSIDANDLRDMFFYMLDAHDWWATHTTDFPFGDDPKIGVSERILRHDSFACIRRHPLIE